MALAAVFRTLPEAEKIYLIFDNSPEVQYWLQKKMFLSLISNRDCKFLNIELNPVVAEF